MIKPLHSSEGSPFKPTIPNLERPVVGRLNDGVFGSDIAAETLRQLDIPYIALTPGASFRGLHDSLVNHLGNQRPSLMLCLHEEHAVAIAHGWAKVTGRPMAAAVHSNVGLFHATMAIFNAWCDRMPALIIGATGPVDAAKRRPWIDWIHTARDQGAIVRSYVKWDDQPASATAARESLLRGFFLTRSAPMAPVYVNLDAEMQEQRLAEPPDPIDASRYLATAATAAPPELVREAQEILMQAEQPVMLVGRTSRDCAAWDARIALAESLGARVITDLKVGAAFPTDHALHAGNPGIYLDDEAAAALRRADAILSLDWVDLSGTFRAVFEGGVPNASVTHVSLDDTLHNGWSMDHQGLPPIDMLLACDPQTVVSAMLADMNIPPRRLDAEQTAAVRSAPAAAKEGPLAVEDIAHALQNTRGDRAVSLLHLPLSWNGAWWPFQHPLDYLGSDGGGGIGGGPGISVGAALALRDLGSGRLPVAIVGDGDFLMGVTAIWTAVHYRIPLMMIVANNRSYYNDEVHQERMARMRNRPVENKWIGQRMTDPEIDLAALARAQGATAFGPVTLRQDMATAFEAAIRATEAGAVTVVDVRVEPGYTPAMTAALARSAT